MSTFAVTNTSEVIDSVNYLLSNLSTGNATGNISVPDGTLVANASTGEITQYNSGSEVYGYVYQYVNLRYATNSSGTTGFSTVPTNATYFGVYNSATPTPSSNPASYQWREVAGGFGLTKTIYYSAIGGRQVLWAAASSPPSSNYVISVANVAIDLDVVTTAAGLPGERGPIAMAYVVTTANPNTSTDSQLTAWFEAPRDAVTPPIGTGLTPPVPGDTATFIYGAGVGTPSGTFSYNGSNWNLVVGQVIDGEVIVANTLPGTSIEAASITGDRVAANTISATNIVTNTITANQIAANTITTNQIAANTITANNISSSYIYAGNIVSFGATLNSNTSPGYWLNYSTGNARFGGNVSIGNTLTIGSNAVIGNNASIGGNLVVSGLITAGALNSNTVITTTITPSAVSIAGSYNTLTPRQQLTPSLATWYYDTTTVSVTTGQLNQPVYLFGTFQNQVTTTQLFSPARQWSLTYDIGLFRKVSSTYTAVGDYQRYVLTNQASTVANSPVEVTPFVGYLDIPVSIGTYEYVYGMRYVSSANIGIPSFEFETRNILAQLLKR